MKTFAEILAVGVACLCTGSFGAEFQADCQLTMELHDPLTRTMTYQKHAFARIYVRNCSWLFWFTRDERLPETDYREVAFDGKNVYVLTSLESRHLVAETSGITNAAGPFGARIRSGPMPDGASDPLALLLWMAYGSHCYLQTVTNGYVSDRATPFGNGKGFLKAEWKFCQDAPWTKEIAMFRDYLSVVGSPPEAEPERSSTGVPYVVYRCFATTNLGGLPIPSSFQLETLVLHDGLLVSNAVIKAMVTSATPQCRISDFRPRFPRRSIQVGDGRFGGRQTLYYNSRKWLSDDEVKGRPEYERMLKKAEAWNTLRNANRATKEGDAQR